MNGKPQLRLAAVKVGDLLKYATTINEINRTAEAIFRFRRENFHIEGISSQRAKLVFDWLMSLFKQDMADQEKRELLKSFLKNISAPDDWEKIVRILVETNLIDDDRPAPGNTAETAVENTLLKLVFQPSLLRRLPLDASLSDVLVARMNEAHVCIESKAYLAAVILTGSVLEGICLGYGSASPERANRAYLDCYKKPAPKFHDWKLQEWVAVLGQLGDLSPNVEKFGQSLRAFRNYVHPAEQLANRFTPDQHTARIGFQVVVAAIEDLVRAFEKQKETQS